MKYLLLLALISLPAFSVSAKPSKAPSATAAQAIHLHLSDTRSKTSDRSRLLLKAKTIRPVTLQVIETDARKAVRPVQRADQKEGKSNRENTKKATLIRVGHGHLLTR